MKALSLDAQSAAQGGGFIWSELNESEREMSAESAARSSRAAAHLIERFGVSGWECASPRVRTTLLYAVARSPEAAAKTLFTIGDCLLGDMRTALARTAMGGAAASRPIAQALIAGSHWRDWMDGFLPGSEHDDATLADWRIALQQAVCAVLLCVLRHACHGAPPETAHIQHAIETRVAIGRRLLRSIACCTGADGSCAILARDFSAPITPPRRNEKRARAAASAAGAGAASAARVDVRVRRRGARARTDGKLDYAARGRGVMSRFLQHAAEIFADNFVVMHLDGARWRARDALETRSRRRSII